MVHQDECKEPEMIGQMHHALWFTTSVTKINNETLTNTITYTEHTGILTEMYC